MANKKPQKSQVKLFIINNILLICTSKKPNLIFHLQVETTTLQQDTIVKKHQTYLQMLKEWENIKQSTTQSNSQHITTKPSISLKFPNYEILTSLIKDQHAHWQIDTIEKLLNRNETLDNISEMVKTQRSKICPDCDRQKHPRWNCPKKIKQAQLRRYKLSRNERKDNQMGDYACHEPFQLLKDTLIPSQVFDLYEK